MKNIVQVKAKHIREAKRLRAESANDCNWRLSRCCPVALAVREHTGKFAGVSYVSIKLYETDSWSGDDSTACFLSTKVVQRKISAFDNHKTLKPFNFKLIPVKP